LNKAEASTTAVQSLETNKRKRKLTRGRKNSQTFEKWERFPNNVARQTNAVQSFETNNRKRKLTRSSKNSQTFKMLKASKQEIAKDVARHTKKAGYERTTLKVVHLKHSAPAYTGNLTRKDGVALPPELGTGYKLLRYIPG
jgi:hypothetical protein